MLAIATIILFLGMSMSPFSENLGVQVGLEEVEVQAALNTPQGINSTGFLASSGDTRITTYQYLQLQQPEYMLNEHLLVTHYEDNNANSPTFGGNAICSSSCDKSWILIINLTSSQLEGTISSTSISSLSYQIANGSLHVLAKPSSTHSLTVKWPTNTTRTYSMVSGTTHVYVFDEGGVNTTSSTFDFVYQRSSNNLWPGYSQQTNDPSAVACNVLSYTAQGPYNFVIQRGCRFYSTQLKHFEFANSTNLAYLEAGKTSSTRYFQVNLFESYENQSVKWSTPLLYLNNNGDNITSSSCLPGHISGTYATSSHGRILITSTSLARATQSGSCEAFYISTLDGNNRSNQVYSYVSGSGYWPVLWNLDESTGAWSVNRLGQASYGISGSYENGLRVTTDGNKLVFCTASSQSSGKFAVNSSEIYTGYGSIVEFYLSNLTYIRHTAHSSSTNSGCGGLYIDSSGDALTLIRTGGKTTNIKRISSTGTVTTLMSTSGGNLAFRDAYLDLSKEPLIIFTDPNMISHSSGTLSGGLGTGMIRLADDLDQDGTADWVDTDDDGDGVIDVNDNCPRGMVSWTSSPSTDPDSDGCHFNEDDDDDNDGINDDVDDCASAVNSYTSTNATDYDADGCRDSVEDDDDDNDGILDVNDACPRSLTVNQTLTDDGDNDGCSDPTEDSDDDNDGVPDTLDDCASTPNSWISAATNDHDGDGCHDTLEDFDDDNDGFNDTVDTCPTGRKNWVSDNNSDIDSDGCHDATEDDDDDNDGVQDTFDACPTEAGDSSFGSMPGCPDSDGDGYGDVLDSCPDTWGNSSIDKYGCLDSDGDGVSDDGDAFPQDETRSRDSDGDGYSDEEDAFPYLGGQWEDSDGDGYGDNPFGPTPDGCKDEVGNSSLDQFGCPDYDGDGVSDEGDAFPYDSTRAYDSDEDGYANNEDQFPFLGGQWADSDGDGYGDNKYGPNGDYCPNTPGNSTVDRYGCPDADGDGVSDEGDAFPYDPERSYDSDNDGWADEEDHFPFLAGQWEDSDGDGYGNNPTGPSPDACPFESGNSTIGALGCPDADEDGYGDQFDAFPQDPSKWQDTDGDGVDDDNDEFPNDATQQTDADGDGWGDNLQGTNADKFPYDSTQWLDIDGDGYGDNPNGTAADAFPTDPTQWLDSDGDGFGDNRAGRNGDQFPADPTQWIDEDGDGLGDNQTGNNPDPSLSDYDNDGYNDTIDPLPLFPSPGDLDNDGTPDSSDLFPSNNQEWADFDLDGKGDNSDSDDDGDGWADADEIRQGTNPFDSEDFPVETFEIVIPGTAVGLGAWDLIGVFGGVPVFIWLMYGMVTRNARTARFENLLREATSRDELEGVAHKSEFALMLRLLGPHQGIRLERIRSELDDHFEAQGQQLTRLQEVENDHTEEVKREMEKKDLVEIKAVPEIETSAPEPTPTQTPTPATPAQTIQKPPLDAVPTNYGDGYEWIEFSNYTWYRVQGEKTEWSRWEH